MMYCRGTLSRKFPLLILALAALSLQAAAQGGSAGSVHGTVADPSGAVIPNATIKISNQMIALRQARSRYAAAVNTRTLQEQLLQAEQNKFGLGTSNISDLVIAQRALVAAQTSEVTALSNYARARVALDQELGETLEVNHVSVDEALAGRVSKP